MWTAEQREVLQALGIDAALFFDMPEVSNAGSQLQRKEAQPELVELEPEAPSPADAAKQPETPNPADAAKQPEAPSPADAAKQPETPNPGQPPKQPEARIPHLYKLGPWALEFSHELPVDRYPWINDLGSYIGSKPSLISATGDKLVQVNCDAYAKKVLNVDEKKALWALLKPALEQRG
ncbi:superantigen-like protein SSL4 [Aliidiomarina indica]|uniref:hypothetical protein n=1 Tax=Aliidiomarina indica TaxID=2749147 RepID=UPI00188FE875|nr:hypothetical protein [Aliidiomarina indica]